MNVRTRIAPSPTGRMHIGTVRTALFNYLYAKKHDGTYIVRIEDTDKERSKAVHEAEIWSDFEWLGLGPDEKYRQSEHAPRHRDLLHELVSKDRAYVSNEQAKDGSGREVSVVRLRNPGRKVTFHDIVRGDITFDTTELGDFVIARSIDDPLYHFAVVADDGDEKISHVIRGEDHISNTPRQILIQEALELPRPVYAHLPLILAPDRSKLSKRKHNASIEVYREAGFLPEAILNFLALLGWNPGTAQEIFSVAELIDAFTLENIQKSGATFNTDKLRWFNKAHLARLAPEVFLATIRTRLESHTPRPLTETEAARIIPILRDRIEVLSDVESSVKEGEWQFVFSRPTTPHEKLTWKDTSTDITKSHLAQARTAFAEADFSPESLKMALWGYAEEHGRGAVLWPVRFALTGMERSPDPFTVASILGKEETLARLDAAIQAV